MAGQAVWATFTKYISSLVLTILAPLQWVRLIKVAGQHRGLDRHATKKIAVGIVAGLALTGVSTYIVVDFHDDATQGVYSTLSSSLSASMGNEAYRAALQDQEAARNLIDTADKKIAEAQEEGDPEKEQLWRENRAQYVTDLNDAISRGNARVDNANLWVQVNHSLLVNRDDDTAMALIDANAGMPGLSVAGSMNHFDKKDQTMDDMNSMLAWFVYPGLIGVLWAPVAFAAGHVLKTTYVPSETIGFKPYPGGAAALFLLFGAFGVPALFFAAWVNQDFADRTEIGQISL